MIPQSVYNNPSFVPECKGYFGCPALSSIYFGFGNNAFKLKNIVQKSNDDSVVFSPENILNHLAKNNHIDLDFRMDILSLGFKVKNNYVTFSLAEKFYMIFNFPQDLLNYFIKGNYNEAFLGKTANLSNISLNALYYHELAIGFNRQVNKNLNIGIRPKFLVGVADIQTKKSDLSIYTAPEEDLHDITLNSEININTHLPEVIFNDSAGTSGGGGEGSEFNHMMSMFGPYITDLSNFGFGIDLGGNYKISSKLDVSLALLDLGYIKWNSSTSQNFSYKTNNARFTFQGLDLIDLFSSGSSDSTKPKPLDKLNDTLSKIFEVSETHQSYTTMLPLKCVADVSFALTKNDKIGVIFMEENWQKRFYTSVGISYTRKFWKFIQLSLNYSYRNRDFDAGFGLALNLGPLQVYAITDNVLAYIFYNEIKVDENKTSIIYPRNANLLTIHAGLNLVFGKGPVKYKF